MSSSNHLVASVGRHVHLVETSRRSTDDASSSRSAWMLTRAAFERPASRGMAQVCRSASLSWYEVASLGATGVVVTGRAPVARDRSGPARSPRAAASARVRHGRPGRSSSGRPSEPRRWRGAGVRARR